MPKAGSTGEVSATPHSLAIASIGRESKPAGGGQSRPCCLCHCDCGAGQHLSPPKLIHSLVEAGSCSWPSSARFSQNAPLRLARQPQLHHAANGWNDDGFHAAVGDEIAIRPAMPGDARDRHACRLASGESSASSRSRCGFPSYAASFSAMPRRFESHVPLKKYRQAAVFSYECSRTGGFSCKIARGRQVGLNLALVQMVVPGELENQRGHQNHPRAMATRSNS